MPGPKTPAEWREAGRRAAILRAAARGTRPIPARPQYERAASNLERALAIREDRSGFNTVLFSRLRGGFTKSVSYAKRKYPMYNWILVNDHTIQAIHPDRHNSINDEDVWLMTKDLNATSTVRRKTRSAT